MANTPDGPKWTAWSVARWRDRWVVGCDGTPDGPKWTAWRMAKWRDIG